MLTQPISNDQYEEEWEVVLTSKGKYKLSKDQAAFLRKAMAMGEKIVAFESFTIVPAYVVEFYRVRRFMKDKYSLPEATREEPYIPMTKEQWRQEMIKIREVVLGDKILPDKLTEKEINARRNLLLDQAEEQLKNGGKSR